MLLHAAVLGLLVLSVDTSPSGWALGDVKSWHSTARTHEEVHKEPRNTTVMDGICGEFRVEFRRLKETNCSSTCQFMRVDASDCQGACLTDQQCQQAPGGGYPNRTNGFCEGCNVAGCRKCGATRHVCEHCLFMMRKLDGGAVCDMPRFPLIHVIFLAMGIAVATVATYVVALACRKNVNSKVLVTALKERELSKLRDESLPGFPLYPLTTLLTRDPIAGRGVLLFFRHMAAMLIWSLLVTVALAWLASMYSLESRMLQDSMCNQDLRAQQEEFIQEVEEGMFSFVLLVYILSTFGSLLLVVWQRTTYRKLDTGTTTMQDFALMAKGFPMESGNRASYPPEQEYKQFFEDVLETKIVGVSVSWYFHKERDAVQTAMAKELAHLEWGEKWVDRLKTEKRPPLAFIDNALCGIAEFNSDSEDDSEDETPKAKNSIPKAGAGLASSFQTSGYAVVVFHRKDDVKQALETFDNRSAKGSTEEEELLGPSAYELDEPFPHLSSPTFIPKAGPRHQFRGKYRIHLARVPCGPGEILWENFGKHKIAVSRDITLGILQVAAFVVLWCIVFYGPYAIFLNFATQMKGQASQLAGSMRATLLGGVITIGNQLVYKVISVVSDRAGFRYTTMADNFNVSLYCIAVVINTVLDLWTVQMLASGQQGDADAAADSALLHGAPLDPVPTSGEAFSEQLFLYLFPMTILGPFVLEGFLYFLNLGVAMMVVRSRPGVGPRRAQDILQLNTFDFTRYADNVINITIVIIFLFYTSSMIFPAFLSLVVSIAYIYVWDTYRVLRGTAEHEMDLDSTENTAQFLLVMPCSLLAGCTVYRYLTTSQGPPGLFDGMRPEATAALAGLLHSVLHFGMVWLLQHLISSSSDGEDEDEDDTFRDLAEEQALSWFNANPIQCLRSKYVLGDNPPCTFCVKGKERLLRVNEAIGCHFDGYALSQSIDEATLLDKQEQQFLKMQRVSSED